MTAEVTPNPNPVNPATHNLAPQGTEPAYDTLVADLLAGPTLEGEVVVDRFIGGLFAGDGVVTGAGEHMGPVAVLNDIQDGIEEAQSKRLSWNQLRSTFTMGRGLRTAIDILARTPKTMQYIPGIADRVKSASYGATFTTAAQLHGYLDGVAQLSGDIVKGEEWKEALWLGMWRYITTDPGQYGEPMPWEKPQTQETDRQRERRERVSEALEGAQNAGVDVELLRRSADEIRFNLAKKREIGGTALQ